MADFTAADVKRLRDLTAAGFVDCKNALTEADGDFDKAVEILRVKGAKDVDKRADRVAANGLVAVSGPAIIELDNARELKEEVFGPVLHVVRWRSSELDRLLDDIAANDTALTLGIHSRIETVVTHVAARMPHGNIYVNRNMIGAVVGSQPFGGSHLSGTGPKAGGPNYLRRFALEQVVTVNTAASGGNATLLSEEE